MRLLLLFAAAALGLAGPVPLAAATIGCNDYAPAVIDVHPVFEEVDYDTAEPMIKIRELAEAGMSGAQPESWPVGLSVGQFYMTVVKDIYKTRSAYDPSSCGQIKAIHIEMGFAKNTIYIAKEFPRRSCPYKTILGHEEKHKTVDRELLQQYTEKAKVFFAKAAQTVGVIRNGSGAALDGEIGEDVSRAMDQFSSEVESERRRRQKEVDSNEEYERVSASCEGAVMRIVNDRLALMEETNPGSTKMIVKKQVGDLGPGVGSDTPAAKQASPAVQARPSNVPSY